MRKPAHTKVAKGTKEDLPHVQHVILLDAIALGFTPLYGAEKLSARSLARKGFGTIERYGQIQRFAINDRGRAVA
jgi:hypothetical protein